jgi:hypothetical protein
VAKNILITKEESQQIAQQIIEKIRYILDNFGPREPGQRANTKHKNIC